jgi:hypothetical protein
MILVFGLIRHMNELFQIRFLDWQSDNGKSMNSKSEGEVA